MTTAIKTKRTAKRRGAGRRDLPYSAEVLNLSGRDYLIVPLDDFEEWDEDRQLTALMAERLAVDEELIPLEEMERRLDAKKKKRS